MKRPLVSRIPSTWTLLLLVFLCPYGTLPAEARGIAPTFTRIADTQTTIPGGTETFTLFADARTLEGGKVAFIAFHSGPGSGVYGHQEGVLSKIADTQTSVPGTTDTFSSFFDVALDGPYVTFTAGWPGPGGGCSFSGSEGLFGNRFPNGTLRAVATSLSTPNNCFHGVEFEQRLIVVAGGVNAADNIHNHSESMMVARSIGNPSVFLDTTTPSPSGGTFVGYDQDFSVEGNGFLFTEILHNSIGAVSGIYTLRNNGLGAQLVADSATAVPGGTGTFSNFAGVDWDGSEVAFVGRTSRGSFLFAGTNPSDLRVVVDSSTPVPGEGTSFGGMSNPIAFEGGVFVFSGFWSGSRAGLFTESNGTVRAILKKDDLLDGKSVDQAFCRPQHKDGNQLLIEVRFQDSSRGLYLVDL